MLVAAGAVIGLFGVFFGCIPAYNNKGIKIEGRTLFTVYQIITVGVKGVFNAVGMLAVGCQGKNVGTVVQQKRVVWLKMSRRKLSTRVGNINIRLSRRLASFTT